MGVKSGHFTCPALAITHYPGALHSITDSCNSREQSILLEKGKAPSNQGFNPTSDNLVVNTDQGLYGFGIDVYS